MITVTERLLQQVSRNARKYFEQYKRIVQFEYQWNKSKISEEHEYRRQLYDCLNDIEKAQVWLIIIADDETCPLNDKKKKNVK
jgi:hypothetical protein